MRFFSEVEMKKLLCLLLVAVTLVGCLSACNKSSLKGDEKGAIITMCVSSVPDTFDPAAYSLDADINKIFSLVYMGLTTLDSNGAVKKGLAYDWGYFYDDIYNEDKMYFKMYTTAWSDGRSLSADDVVYAWKRILSPETDSPFASLLFPIKNAKEVKAGVMTSDDLGLAAVDDTRLEITFEDGYVKDNGKDVASQFAETVANVAFSPLREDRIGSVENWTLSPTVSSVVCCGPYYLRTYSVDTKGVSTLELERNRYYRRNEEEDDALDKYVTPYKIFCQYDFASGVYEDQLNKYNEGDAFYLGEFSPDTYNEVSDIESADSLSSYVYYFNTQKEVFADSRVRKALSMAIDREHIAGIIGCGSVAATGFVPDGVFNTKKGTSFRENGSAIYSTTSQIDDAKKLISEAGIKCSDYSFTISFITEPENDINKQVAEYVAGVWSSEFGFDVSVAAVDSTNTVYTRNVIYKRTNREAFDVLAIDLSLTSPNASAYLAPFASGYSGNYINIRDKEAVDLHITGFNSEEYNALTEKAIYTSDRAERAELLHQLETMFGEECPATALVFYKNSYVASSKLSGYSTYYGGAPKFFKTTLKGWRDVNAKIEAEESVEMPDDGASAEASVTE